MKFNSEQNESMAIEVNTKVTLSSLEVLTGWKGGQKVF